MTKEQYKDLCNQPVYKIQFARLKHSVYGHVKGSEFPVLNDYIMAEKGTIYLMSKTSYAINSFPVSENQVELFEKEFTPKYKLGDVLYKIGSPDELGAFRVWEYYFDRVEIAYRDGWGVGTNLASQVYESNLRLATEKEGQSWCIEYNDNIVKERKPELYASVLTPIQ
jgi:hypothetical protein